MTPNANILKKEKRIMTRFTRVFWRNNADPRKLHSGPKIINKDTGYYHERIEDIVYKKTDLKTGCMPPLRRNDDGVLDAVSGIVAEGIQK